MTERFLLHTNILSDLVRSPRGRANRRIAQAGEQNVSTSIIVAAELRYGAAKRGSAQLLEQLDAILRRLAVLPFEPPSDIVYGELRARLEKEGNLIGPNDLLIAAHAVSLNVTLVTDNEREFSRVPGLRIENWLR